MAPTSILAKLRDEMFERIEVEIEFLDRLLGGNPQDPKLIEGWLRKQMGITNQEELFHRLKQHIFESGQYDEETQERINHASTIDDLISISGKLATELHTQVFKRTPDGCPYIEGRQIKAAVKEVVNVVYSAHKWGPTRKGARGFTAERVFMDSESNVIEVGRPEDVSVDSAVGHVTGPRGPQSTLGYYEYVEKKKIRFVMRQLISGKSGSQEPALNVDTWCHVLAHMELNGLGARRSQGFGQFVVTSLVIDGQKIEL